MQHFVDLRDGSIIGIHKVKLVTTSDTVTVPDLANTTSNASSDQIRNAGEVAATVTDNGNNTVTIVGTVGETVTLVTHHRHINSGSES